MKNIIKALLTSCAFTFITDLSTTNIYILIIFGLLYYFYYKLNNKGDIYSKITAIVFGCFGMLELFQVTVYPSEMAEIGLIFKLVKIAVTFMGVYFFAERLISNLFTKLDCFNGKEKIKLSPNKLFIISVVVLILVYLPTWLMEYPSNIGADTLDQIKQILNGSFRNHHPFAHTMWLKLLMSFGKDINQRIGIASLIQLILNATIFGLLIKTVYKKTGNIIYALITLAFFSLLSFNSFLAVNLIKDVTHAMVTVLLCIALIEYFDCDNIKKKKMLLIIICVISVAFCLFRTNGYYAFIFMTIVLLPIMLKNKENKLFIIFCISIVASALIKGPIYDLLQVKNGSFAENLSIPLQQIALVIKNGRSLSSYQENLLSKILDLRQIPDSYDVFLSDPIKNMVNNSGNVDYLKENIFEYFKVWISIGLKYPWDYIQAWVNQVSTFFSPRYYGTSITWNLMKNSIGITASPLINIGIDEKLHLLAYTQHNIPLLGLFHYPAISTWVVVTMLFYSIRNKKTVSIIITTLMFGIFLTLMISCPYNICFRYYYSVVCCVPLILLVSINKGGNDNEQ